MDTQMEIFLDEEQICCCFIASVIHVPSSSYNVLFVFTKLY